MTITLNGTTGISNDGGYTGDGVSFADDTPSNTLVTDTSGNVKISTLQFNSGYGSVATAYGCRAWVNFNGTGTVAIRASGNVSSITDNGTGDYTVNFTNAMSDVNYALAGSGDENADSPYVWLLSKTTSGSRVKFGRYGTNLGDPLNGSVTIFR
jgi:hypothetical protein